MGWRGHAGNIEYGWNKIAEVGQAGLEDFGAVYVSCANSGYTKVHHNYIDGTPSDSLTSSIYMDVLVDKAEVFNNVVANVTPGKPWRLFRKIGEWIGVTWINIIMSTNIKAYDNWSSVNPSIYRDVSIPRYRFWRHKSNKVYDNTHIEDNKPLPLEAQEVADKAGLEPPYRSMKAHVDHVVFSE